MINSERGIDMKNITNNKTIMVVDDSIGIRNMVVYTLESSGYEVIVSVDGMDALKKINGNKIHLIICNVNMPNMDGISFVKEVRGKNGFKYVPIIMLSSENKPKRILEAREAGADVWMDKPFQPHQLLKLASDLIGLNYQ